MANEQTQNGKGKYQIDEITYTKLGLLLMTESCKLWTLRSKFWISQIWTLINNFVTVLACTKCSKLITLEENIISAQ